MKKWILAILIGIFIMRSVGLKSSDFKTINGASIVGSGDIVTADFTSVKSYGAVGNGSTDDTAAIQAAFDAGTNVFFPPGTYIASNLTVTNDTTKIYGNGSASIVKQKSDATGYLLTTGEKRVTMIDLTLDGGLTTTQKSVSSSPASRSGLLIASQQDSHMDRVTIKGFGLYGMVCSDSARVRAAPHLRVHGVKFYNNWQAVSLPANSEYVTFSDCHAAGQRFAFEIVAGNVFFLSVNWRNNAQLPKRCRCHHPHRQLQAERHIR